MKTRKTKTIGGRTLTLIRQYFPKVQQVIDANSRVIVEVTQQDVKQAKIKDPAMCALARACYRSFRADGVIIGLTTSYIIRNRVAVRYHNTNAISREIISFDRRAGFDIGRYQLSPPPEKSRLGTDRGGGTHKTPKGRDRIQFRHYTTGVRVLNLTEETR